MTAIICTEFQCSDFPYDHRWSISLNLHLCFCFFIEMKSRSASVSSNYSTAVPNLVKLTQPHTHMAFITLVLSYKFEN